MKTPLDKDYKESSCFGHFYRAEVVSDDDPLKSGRVKVKVYPMMENVADDCLPWAPVEPFPFGGLSGYGSVFIPKKDTRVWVIFEAGDILAPIVVAGSRAKGELPDEALDGYPDTHVLKTDHISIVMKETSIDIEVLGDAKVDFNIKPGSSIVKIGENPTQRVVRGDELLKEINDLFDTSTGHKHLGGTQPPQPGYSVPDSVLVDNVLVD